MSKMMTIFKNEYRQVVQKKSFVIGIVLIPALMFAFTALPTFLATTQPKKTMHMAIVDQSEMGLGQKFAGALSEYMVDDTDIPAYTVDSLFILGSAEAERFATLSDSLRTLVTADDLKWVLVFKEDAHLVDSNIYLITNSENFITINRFEKRLSEITSSARLEMSSVNLSVDSVLVLSRHIDLNIQDAKGDSIPFMTKYFIALAMVGIIMMMLLGYGSQVMRTIIEEKNSRIMEVLVSSVTPFQLMAGKILGLGAATMTQVAVWFAIGIVLYTMRGSLEIGGSVDRILFNPMVTVFFVIFLIGGYLLYSSLFALIGSIVTTEKEAQNLVSPISLSLVLPFILAIYVIQEPNSTLSIVLSLIPFLTPTMMAMRIVFVAPSLTEYSLFSGILGQAILGTIVLALTIVLVLWATGKVFRIGILMYGKRATLPEIIKWLRH